MRTQLRALKKFVSFEGELKPGQVFWVTGEQRIRHLLEQGLCETLVPLTQPGPTEAKPLEATEKKSFDARTGGPSTDSASSSERGPEIPSSFSEEVRDLRSGWPFSRGPRIKRGSEP